MAGIRVKPGQKLDYQNVAFMLSKQNITWKQQCDILCIAHNKPRLTKIIAQHEKRIQTQKKIYKANSRKPFSDLEISRVIASAIQGDSIASIASDMFRSTAAVKKVIDKVGVPRKDSACDYFKPMYMPYACIAQSFSQGQIVWSAQHQCLAIVRSKVSDFQYRVYILEKIDWSKVDKLYVRVSRAAKYGGFQATLSIYQLGSLQHLRRKYGVDLYRQVKNDFPKWKVQPPQKQTLTSQLNIAIT